MRVCMMNDNFYRSSGVAIAIKRIYRAASQVEYCFAGCLNENLLEDISWIPAGQFQRFDFKSLNPIRLAKELRRFKQWFTHQRCDLVHCHHRRLAALLQLNHVPVLYTAQLAFPSSAWFRYLAPKQMTAITPSVARNLVETTGNPAIACISNPASFPLEVPDFEVDKVRSKALCIGRLEDIKGHRHLLSAWKLLVDRGYSYELDLIGEGPLLTSLKAQTRDDGTDHLIHFKGYTADVQSAIKVGLFAILVSSREGQGIVTLEAAAMGRPSLLTAVPGSVDMVPAGSRLKNGLRFGDVPGLANALEMWFGSAELVKAEGKLFFDYLKASSDPVKLARDYFDTYQLVVAGIA